MPNAFRLLLAFTFSCGLSVLAQAQAQEAFSYDLLLAISEPADFDPYAAPEEYITSDSFDRVAPREALASYTDALIVPAAYVPAEAEAANIRGGATRRVAAASRATTTLAPASSLDLVALVQGATAYRLRGMHAEAAAWYGRIIEVSDDPINHYFYAQALRATGHELLGDVHMRSYTNAQTAAAQLREPAAAVPTASLSGVVTNAAWGNAVPNAEVRLLDLRTEQEYVVYTDDEGRYEFASVPQGSIAALRVSKRFFGQQHLNLPELVGAAQVDMELPMAGK